jgi:hypothetical protein
MQEELEVFESRGGPWTALFARGRRGLDWEWLDAASTLYVTA